MITNAIPSPVREFRSTLFGLVAAAIAVVSGAVVASSPRPTVGAALVAAAAIAAVAITAPLKTLYIAILAVPLEFISVNTGFGTVSPPEGLIVLSAVGWLVSSCLEGRSPIPASRMTWPLALLSLSVFPGLIVAPHTSLVVKASVVWVVFLLVYGMVVSEGDVALVRRVIYAMAAAGGVTGAIAIYQSHGHLPKIDSLGDVATNRAIGSFSQPNTLAMFLAMALMCTLAVMQERRGWTKALALVALALCAGGLVLSLSRGGFVAVAFGLVPFLWWAPIRRTVIAILTALAIAVIAVGAQLQSLPVVGEVVKRLGSIGAAAHGQNPRWAIWETTLRMIRDHGITGIGTYQFPYVSGARYGLYQPHTAQPYGHAHNFVLTITVERGLLGLAAIVLGVALLPKVVARATSLTLGENRIYGLTVTAALVVFFAKGLFDYDTGNNLVAALLFLFCGCATVMAETTQDIASTDSSATREASSTERA